MDPSKAKAVLELLKKKHLLLRGLREIKKRLCLNSDNAAIFMKLDILPIILRIVQENRPVEVSDGAAATREEDVAVADTTQDATTQSSARHTSFPSNYPHIQRTVSRNAAKYSATLAVPFSATTLRSAAPTATLSAVPAVSHCETDEILLSCSSVLTIFASDSIFKNQFMKFRAMELILPVLRSQNLSVVSGFLRIINNLLRDSVCIQSFIDLSGPQLLVSLFLRTLDVSVQRALLNSIRLSSSCSKICSVYLSIYAIKTVCKKGLATPLLHEATAKLVAHYCSVRNPSAIAQVLDGTGELVMLLRAWQDHRSKELHSATLRVVQQLLRLAAHSRHSQSKPGRLINALYTSKAATVLVVELLQEPELPNEDVIRHLCTLCDGSLDAQDKSYIDTRSGVALSWLQVVEAGGVPLLVSLLHRPPPSVLDEDDAVGAVQRLILYSLLAIENSYQIVVKVMKLCLASNILPALAVHFDIALAAYRSNRRPFSPNFHRCIHSDLLPSNDDSLVSSCNSDAIEMSSLDLDENCHSGSLSSPLAPLSPPVSQVDINTLVYVPLSPSSSPPPSPKIRRSSLSPSHSSEPASPSFYSPPSSPCYSSVFPSGSTTSVLNVSNSTDNGSHGMQFVLTRSCLDSGFVAVKRRRRSSDGGLRKQSRTCEALESDCEEQLFCEDMSRKDDFNSRLSDEDAVQLVAEKYADILSECSSNNSEQNKGFKPSSSFARRKGVITSVNNVTTSHKEQKLPRNVNSESATKKTSWGVHVRHFSNIKFRVGSRNKRQNYDTNFERKSLCVKPGNKIGKWSLKSDRSKASCTLALNAARKESKAEVKSSVLTVNEQKSLKYLEAVVRIIIQVSYVKEALSALCESFLPRVVLYLQHAQLLHPLVVKLLENISRTPCSIPYLLDTLFPAYVHVQLCEASIVSSISPESAMNDLDSISNRNSSANACKDCWFLSSAGILFLNKIRRFFGHVHMYGYMEANNRLSVAQTRETCLLNLPHVTGCPQLLYTLLSGGGLSDLYGIVTDVKHQEFDSARYVYATAALSALTVTLKVRAKFQPRKQCVFCLWNNREMSAKVFEGEHKMTRDSCDGRKCRRTDCLWLEKKMKNVKLFAQCTDWLPLAQEKTSSETSSDESLPVLADKEVLSDASNVFSVMLSSTTKEWREASTGEIRVVGMNRSCLQAVIHFLHGCRCPALDAILDLSVPEAVSFMYACDMYGLHALKNIALQQVVNKCRSDEDVLHLASTLVDHIHSDLIATGLIELLSVGDVRTWQRAQWLHGLASTAQGQHLLLQLKQLLLEELTSKQNLCLCDRSNSLYMVTQTVYNSLI